MNGLILVGGQSQRMGTDKSLIIYHQQPQWAHLHTLLTPYCNHLFLSCRKDQSPLFPENKLLIDTYETGPLGGVLTAFEYDEHTAWLVVACDMPFVNTATFDFLIHHRSPEHIATAFKNPLTQLPEPLLSIWEPTSYYFLKEAYQNGQRSPLKILHNTDSHLIDCPDEHWLWNANTVEEFTQMANILAQCK